MADSSVHIEGNVTRDPELRFTPSGNAVVAFSVAVNRRWQNRQTNEWEEQTSFFNCSAWNALAENVGDCLKKGDRVVVTGQLEQRTWETPEGDKRSTVELKADAVAASLKFATVNIVRNQRKDAGERAPHPATVGAPAGEELFNLDNEEPF